MEELVKYEKRQALYIDFENEVYNYRCSTPIYGYITESWIQLEVYDVEEPGQ